MKNLNGKSALAAAFLSVGAMAVASTSSFAGYEASKYNKTVVKSKSSFHALKHDAKKLDKAGLAKVHKIKRHGKVVGFTKTLKSGDKIVVRKGHHGKTKKTILKRKTFAERVKYKWNAKRHALKAKRHAWKAKAKAYHAKRKHKRNAYRY